MLLRSSFCIVIRAAVEYQITWLQLLEREVDGQSVVLVGLVPEVELEAKLITQVFDYLSDETGAVQVQRRVVVFVTFVRPILRVVRDAKVGFGSVYEALAQMPLERRIAPVPQSYLLRQAHYLYLRLSHQAWLRRRERRSRLQA